MNKALMDRICDYYDSHPDVTIQEMARIFKVPTKTIKSILMSY